MKKAAASFWMQRLLFFVKWRAVGPGTALRFSLTAKRKQPHQRLLSFGCGGRNEPTTVRVAVPEKIFALLAQHDFFDRCPCSGFLFRPQDAVALAAGYSPAGS